MAITPRKPAKPAASKEAPAVAAKPAAAPAVAVVEAAAPAPVEASVAVVAPAAVVKTVEKVQTAAKKAAVETAGALEDSFTAASKSLQAFSAKAMEAYQANAAASVEYVQALAGVRSVSEAISLQSEHMRKQYETLASQAKEVATDAAGPLKDQLNKAFKPN
jgi:hypothetical protein